jgi:hypothetical protein
MHRLPSLFILPALIIFGKNGNYSHLYANCRIDLKKQIEQHIALLNKDVFTLKPESVIQQEKRLSALHESLKTMQELRKGFKGQRGLMMENANKYLLIRLSRAMADINRKQIEMIEKQAQGSNTAGRSKFYGDRYKLVEPLLDENQNSQLHLQKQQPIADVYEQQRAKELDSVLRSMNTLRLLFSEIDSVVHAQYSQISHIISNVDYAVNYTQLGARQVERRAERERVNTWTLSLFLITVIVFLGTLFLVVKK